MSININLITRSSCFHGESKKLDSTTQQIIYFYYACTVTFQQQKKTTYVFIAVLPFQPQQTESLFKPLVVVSIKLFQIRNITCNINVLYRITDVMTRHINLKIYHIYIKRHIQNKT